MVRPRRALHPIQLAQLLEQGVGGQVQLGVDDLGRAGAGQGGGGWWVGVRARMCVRVGRGVG